MNTFRDKAYVDMSQKEHTILRDEQFEVIAIYATNTEMDAFNRLDSIRSACILVALHEEFIRGIR